MFKKYQKIIAVVLMMTLAISLFAGCAKDDKKDESGASSKTETNDKDADGGSDATESTDGPVVGEDVTFSYWSADTTAGQLDDEYQSPVSQEILSQTGVTIEKEFVIGDPREKLSFMAASGEYPDLIYALEYSNIIVEAGGYVRLDELIDEYGPNIKKLYGDDLARLRYSQEDPSIYFLGLPTVDRVRNEPEIGFQLSHEAVQSLGYPKMETLEDFEKAIQAYVDANPTTDGKPTIGLSLLADDWRLKISVTNPAVAATGGPDDGEWYYDTETGEASLHLMREEEREYFRWLNHMNDIGLLDPESFIQKYDQYQAKIAEGRVVALADAKWEYVDAETALISAGMPEKAYGMYPLTLDDSYTYADFRPTGYAGGYGVGISTSCEDPVAAIKFLDWMCTEEAQILFRWGIEGEHYEVIDGHRKFYDEVFTMQNEDPSFPTKTGIGIYEWPWPGYGQGALDSNGDYFSPVYVDTIIEGYSDIEKEVLEAYGATMWKDLYPDESNFEKSPYGVLWQINIPADTDAVVIMARYDEITAKRIPEAVLAPPSEFDERWDAYMKELEDINVALLEEEFNKLIDQKIELWTN